MNEALKYQGWKYVYGGSNPNTSFDCSAYLLVNSRRRIFVNIALVFSVKSLFNIQL